MAPPAPRWFAAPHPGDIVWCRFPQRGLPGPGPKPRPALVLREGEHAGHTVVEVCYGTSQKTDHLYAGEFAITPADDAAFTAAGLSYPTKFNLGETFELDFNDQWFAIAPGAPRSKSPWGTPHGQTPKLGLLHPSLMRRAAKKRCKTPSPRLYGERAVIKGTLVAKQRGRKKVPRTPVFNPP